MNESITNKPLNQKERIRGIKKSNDDLINKPTNQQENCQNDI